ncbi:alpha/beta hydrolase [Enterococcus sp. DIV0756]|uniref:alpha/beta hydrolase n=1 Tax=Enterococcus sp. DIV0756 TaxID=2774636 RepID=UPI003F243492
MKLTIMLTKLLYQLTTLNRSKYNDTFPIEPPVEKFRNVPYSRGTDKKQVLDIYTPAVKGKFPVFIQIHGGGWTLGDKDDNIGYCEYIASKGYVSVAINYSLAPKAPHPKQERIVFDAIRWINEHIAAYGGNPQRIFLAGDSGGAHLASTVANVCTNLDAAKVYGVEPPLREEQLAGMVLFYGAYDFLSAKYAKFPFIKVSYESFLGTMDDKNDREFMIEASPINYVTEEFPRTILLSGEIDGLHDSQTLQFSKCLKEKQIPVTEVFFDQTREDAVHGFMVDYSRECTKESMEKVLEFLADR